MTLNPWIADNPTRHAIATTTGLTNITDIGPLYDYVFVFTRSALDYVLDDDSIHTLPCDVPQDQYNDLTQDVVDLLLTNDRKHYKALTAAGISADDAGASYAAVRSGHGAHLLNDALTADAKFYGDFDIH